MRGINREWHDSLVASDAEEQDEAYTYDGLDRRINKSSASAGNHDYYYSDQWQILDDYNGSAKRHMFVWGLRYPDDLLARLTHNGTSYATRYWVLHDYLHVTAVMDTSANVQMRLGYDGYGLPRLMNASYVVTNPPAALQDWEFRFGAAYWDSESGLYQVRYRYLHPRVGTWLTRDPIGYQGGVSLSWYAANNPTTQADPSGLRAQKPPNTGKPTRSGAACNAYNCNACLKAICNHAGNGSWAQCVRGCLLAYWNPATCSYSSGGGGPEAHALCWIACGPDVGDPPLPNTPW